MWRSNVSFYDPGVWWQSGWTIMLTAHLVIPLDYYEPSLTWRSTSLLAFCLVGFSTSWLVGRSITIRRSVVLNDRVLTTLAIPKEVVLLFIVGTVLYCLIVAVIVPSKLHAVAASGGGSLGDIRQAHWEEHDVGGRDLVTWVASASRPFAVLAAISLPFFLRKSGVFTLMSASAAVALFMENWITGGRFILMMVVFLMAYTAVGVTVAGYQSSSGFFNVHRMLSAKAKAAIAFLIVVACVLTAIFPYVRNPDLATDPDRYIERLYAASVSHDNISNAGRVLIYGLGYLADPLPKLTFFLEHTDVDQWFAMGTYSFPTLMWPVNKAFGYSMSWLDLRSAIAAELTQANLPSNPWSTGMRDLVIDYGTVGAILAVSLLGIFSGAWGCHADKNRNWFTICGSAALGLWLFLMAFMNISLVGPFFNSLLLTAVLYLVLRIGGAKKSMLVGPVKRPPAIVKEQ